MRVKYYNQKEVDFINVTFGRRIKLGKHNKVQLNAEQKRIFLNGVTELMYYNPLTNN